MKNKTKQDIVSEIKNLMSSNDIEQVSAKYFGQTSSSNITDIGFSGKMTKSLMVEFHDIFLILVEKLHKNRRSGYGGGGTIICRMKDGKLTVSHTYFDLYPACNKTPDIVL